MTEAEMHWIANNLGPLLKAETRLSTKEAYNFATDFVKLLKLKYWGIDELDKPGLNPSYSAIDELNTIDPIIFKVSSEEWEQLNNALNEPPKVSKELRRLFGKHEGRDE